jgi:hypothetical protein
LLLADGRRAILCNHEYKDRQRRREVRSWQRRDERDRQVANEKLVAALKAGGERWDRFVLQYTTEFPGMPFDISDADLRGLSLSSVTFPVRARFDGSHFKEAELVGTVFGQSLGSYTAYYRVNAGKPSILA